MFALPAWMFTPIESTKTEAACVRSLTNALVWAKLLCRTGALVAGGGAAIPAAVAVVAVVVVRDPVAGNVACDAPPPQAESAKEAVTPSNVAARRVVIVCKRPR
ncbi:MAG: hypothetical protein NVSMB5_10660 [Candidatus Velthaea sp.]